MYDFNDYELVVMVMIMMVSGDSECYSNYGESYCDKNSVGVNCNSLVVVIIRESRVALRGDGDTVW